MRVSDPEVGDKTTTARPRFDPTPQGQVVFTLAVIEGPDQGLVFQLDASQPSRILIGQSAACAVRLTDQQVSRRHAAMEVADRGVRITDLGSTNGTSIDGVTVVEAIIHQGAVVRLGDTVLRVEPRSERSAALSNAVRFGKVIGASAEMRRLYPLCERLASSDVAVVIEGQTGTGKEVLAEALHDEGSRAAGPFVVFDCTAVPANLIEAELFGHERGAFTGAVAARKGVFEQAHGGTLLVDEIGDLDPALQPKLLRAIERCEVRRIGSDRAVRVDVRLLAATRRNLDHEVAAGRFRDDLFHRLTVTRIELPPLARRRGDVTVLARHFCRELSGDERALSNDLLRRWEDYEWPGNVRELRNAVVRQVALGELANLQASDPEASDPASEADLVERILGLELPLALARQKLVDEFERRYVVRVLARHGGNVTRAAEASGLARRYFRLLKARQSK